jgi:hypothetical protein
MHDSEDSEVGSNERELQIIYRRVTGKKMIVTQVNCSEENVPHTS